MRKTVDVLISPELRRDTRWSRAVQKAVCANMQEWFVTVSRQKLSRVLRELIATAGAGPGVRRAQRMLDEISPGGLNYPRKTS